MGLAWVRSTALSENYEQGSALLGRLANGSSYLRVRFRWGVYADTTDRMDIQSYTSNLISFGLVTTIGNGTETPPNARTQSNNQAPPIERWLYWETRQMQPAVISIDGGVITWRDSGSTEQTDTHAEVLATGMADDDTLNLWASWAAPSTWDPTGVAQVWLGASVLYKTP